MNQLQICRQFRMWYRYYVCEFSLRSYDYFLRYLIFKIFVFQKVVFFLVCILFKCVLRVKEFLYEFQRFEVKTDLALFSNHNFSWTRTALCILENGNDVLFTYFCFAFSKGKLCNGENFRINFDKFRCFWASWVRIIGF